MTKGVFSIVLLFFAQLFSVAQINLMQPTNLVFEGAGIRGIAYCGALQALKEQGILQNVERVAGTSSGAITATLFAIGYTPDEMERIIRETNFGKFNDGGGLFIGGIHRLKKRLGWYKGKKFHRWIETLIEAKTGNKHISFAELEALRVTHPEMKTMVVAATCINHQESIFFSAQTFPNMSIADAVRASMAIPFYFEPMVVDSVGKPSPKGPNHHVCVDGGFTANFPITLFDQAPYCIGESNCVASTLGLRIDSDEQIASDRTTRELIDFDVQDLGDFGQAFYYMIKETMNRYALTEQDWARTISVSDARIGPKVKSLSKEQNDKLLNSGRKAVEDFVLMAKKTN
jgi:NTE family protein